MAHEKLTNRAYVELESTSQWVRHGDTAACRDQAGDATMDADQAATVFVEICTRLDELLEAQRKTNELLAGLESVLRNHSESRTGADGESFPSSRPQRGLGHLIPPYGDDIVRPVAAVAPGGDPLVT